MDEDVKAWIAGSLIGPDGYFAPAAFVSSLPLYSTPLAGTFLLSLIDGASTPAPFRVPAGRSPYYELIRSVRRASGDERAYGFYITNPDNAVSVLAWVRRWEYDFAPDAHLEWFERHPAVEGGTSYLGLAGESRRWLLLHEYNPSESSFAISIHGPREFCRAVAWGVGLPA